MLTDLFALLAFVLISTFTPGPSNISSASIAVAHGYKDTLRYQAGLAAGVFLMMLLSGLLSTTLLRFFPVLEPVLRYAGAGYILYLAFGILKASFTVVDQNDKLLGFGHGLMLQLLNPKLWIYAFTLFSVFLTKFANSLAFLVPVSALLAAISFGATTVWATFGTGINTYLGDSRLKAMVNILLSLSLVYTAIALAVIS
jgi:cysteine/O-acetylserine efflux protein